MIDQLVATLALAHQRHTPCSRLKKAELVRLKIAAQLLKDTDILIIDNVTKHMDIYEMAFVIDYLRDWAIKLNRIVILAIAPPSFEILLMFSQCTGLRWLLICLFNKQFRDGEDFPGALLTSGQIVYCGPPTQMVHYFTSIDFPCPKFKNPCDFYVDLATHDHQSAAASAESSARIAKLIQCWEALKAAPLQVTKSTVSPMLSRPSMIDVVEAVCRRNWYEFTNKPMTSLYEPLMALLMSCLIGAAFFSMTRDKRAAASDRIGLVLSLSYFGLIPLIFLIVHRGEHLDDAPYLHEKTLLTIRNYFFDGKQPVSRSKPSSRCFGDLEPPQYSSSILEFLWELPLLTLTAVFYSVPVPFLTGMNISSDNQFLWILSVFVIIFVHLLLWRLISKALVFLCSNSSYAFFITLVLLTISHLTSGLVVHPAERQSFVFYSHWLSPNRWVSQALLESEFLGSSLMEAILEMPVNNSELTIGCERKEVLAKMIRNVSQTAMPYLFSEEVVPASTAVV
ncbi:ABC-2 type transporter, partial [Cooperia oncophora]